ncbi:acyltransferase family protein [Tatumella sp. UBA2305]|uniref:acyltransferase family protein n=1 Tax=Tatumella sp. UBA2305 TaxID=1947647 RepID=UPI0025FCE7A7|nr:acyltransferase [Tatumella sp. UBA2305]
MITERRNIHIIQVYRGLAALAVIFYHYSWFISPLEQTLLRRGYLGVDIFFMVSGFLVWITTRQLQAGWQSSLRYIVKRSMRIIPAYALVTLGYALYFAFTRPTADLIWQTFKSLLFIPLNGGNSPAYGFPLLENGWTLNYEFFFI